MNDASHSLSHAITDVAVAELGRQVLGGGYTVEVEAEGGVDVGSRLSSLAGVRSLTEPAAGRWRLLCDRDLRPEAAAAVVGAGGRLYRLSLDQPSLETIYTRYFHKEGVPHAA